MYRRDIWQTSQSHTDHRRYDRRRTLRDLTFEWGNMLAKVDLDHPFKEPDERLVQLFRDNYSMEKNGN